MDKETMLLEILKVMVEVVETDKLLEREYTDIELNYECYLEVQYD